MKKYSAIIFITLFIVLMVAGLMIYRKKLLNDRLEKIVGFDFFAGTQFKKGQPVRLNQNSVLNQVFESDGEMFVSGKITVKTSDKLTYVGKYNSLNVVKKKGWFFDRYFLVTNDLII
ncbi:MAG TPA: hypothetical protein PKK18_04060 [Chitinophagales bacterium]|nr:hypothetical protein [Chitinophagales bacterium]HMW12316.1 hypothetical protein [Chitinophagales bacterium]HMX59782.1 hypothetical protein [Chitinophagales bacterium]HMY22590.1 hypothetical protein [Chitinophagales bacterium]HMZ33438.1 hypothetical protein [Chitinophagales bacterium]